MAATEVALGEATEAVETVAGWAETVVARVVADWVAEE